MTAVSSTQVTHHTIEVDGLKVFFRTAGNPKKSAILLLHGFPSASHMFRNLMPELADDFHLVAPDYIGFGQSECPSRERFNYTFEHLADVVEHFTEKLGLSSFAMYVFDYGAPIGFRLAVRHPERIRAIVSQNGNVYREGLGPKWADRAKYWANPTKELREKYKSAFAPETIIGQYTFGTEEGKVAPDGYTLDIHYMHRPGMDEIQSDLIFDYQSNVALYPSFQKYLRDHQPPLLAVWGENDPSFIPAGAKAFRNDLPNAEIHFVDSGHFALESRAHEIAELMREFLFRNLD